MLLSQFVAIFLLEEVTFLLYTLLILRSSQFVLNFKKNATKFKSWSGHGWLTFECCFKQLIVNIIIFIPGFEGPGKALEKMEKPPWKTLDFWISEDVQTLFLSVSNYIFSISLYQSYLSKWRLDFRRNQCDYCWR